MYCPLWVVRMIWGSRGGMHKWTLVWVGVASTLVLLAWGQRGLHAARASGMQAPARVVAGGAAHEPVAPSQDTLSETQTPPWAAASVPEVTPPFASAATLPQWNVPPLPPLSELNALADTASGAPARAHPEGKSNRRVRGSGAQS